MTAIRIDSKQSIVRCPQISFVSKNRRFQKIDFKKKTVKKQQISRNNRFQETTDSKKQQISKNNKFHKATNFKKKQISKNRFQKQQIKNNIFQ